MRTLYPGIETGEESYRPFNFVTGEDRQAARALLPRVASPQIGIHPSAGRALKQWEEKKFAALIDLLSEAGERRAHGLFPKTGHSSERIAGRAQTTPKSSLARTSRLSRPSWSLSTSLSQVIPGPCIYRTRWRHRTSRSSGLRIRCVTGPSHRSVSAASSASRLLLAVQHDPQSARRMRARPGAGMHSRNKGRASARRGAASATTLRAAFSPSRSLPPRRTRTNRARSGRRAQPRS